MGCWNATCNVTNLPIRYGEKVVLIPLAKVKEKCEFNVCYPTDVFVPFGLPIFGEYDEYGRIENVETVEENKEHLMKNFNYFYGKSDGAETQYELAEKKDNFEDFVQRILCCQGGCFIKTDSMLHKDGMVEINYMMIHYEAYKIMVDEIANRKPYDSKINMRETITNRTLEKIAKVRDEIENYKKLQKELAEKQVDDERRTVLFGMMEFECIRDLSKTVFSIGMLNPCAVAWHGLAQKLIDGANSEALIEQSTNIHLFTQALSCLRKGYLCDSGAGSQSEETRMHYLIAKFVMKHLRDYANERNAENTDEYKISSHGERETFFM